MEEVKLWTKRGDYAAARKSMAAYIRRFLEQDRFFQIPYEKPENIHKYPYESDAKACRRICDHTLISVGVPCAYGRGQTGLIFFSPFTIRKLLQTTC